MVKEFYAQAEEQMKKVVEATQRELATIRTGKATTSLLDGIKVEYYGSMVPIFQVASVGIPEMRQISIQPWEKNMIPVIERAILKSDLGLTPTNDGTVIRLTIPLLTEERRRSLAKVIRRLAEEGKIAVRNIRRDTNDRLKKAEKDSEISEDEERRAKEKIQELTDKYVGEVDEVVQVKEKEIMEV